MKSYPVFSNITSHSIVADYSPVAWRGRSYGISFFCSFGIGSFSATFLGYIAERSNTSWIFGHHGWHLAGSPYMRCGSSG
jgi:hypothetical protein